MLKLETLVQQQKAHIFFANPITSIIERASLLVQTVKCGRIGDIWAMYQWTSDWWESPGGTFH